MAGLIYVSADVSIRARDRLCVGPSLRFQNVKAPSPREGRHAHRAVTMILRSAATASQVSQKLIRVCMTQAERPSPGHV